MANPEHLKILRSGVEIWNQWREANPGIRPNLFKANLQGVVLDRVNLCQADLNYATLSHVELSHADLSFATLSHAHLNFANLSHAQLAHADINSSDLNKANLGRAILIGVNFNNADLNGANLCGAALTGADLLGAKLNRVDLSEASLLMANLSRAELSGAILFKAEVFNTSLIDMDLSEAIGLETVIHYGPSSISINTLFRSQGKIPEIFLRGAGVPETLIEYLPSLITGKAIQYYSVFISYSTKDEDFAKRLYADLQARGVRCWFAPDKMKDGLLIHDQMRGGIKYSDKLLLILSEESMKSNWVKTEILEARKDEAEGKPRKLFPLGLAPFEKIKQWEFFDPDTGEDLGKVLLAFYIPDFSHWKEDHDSYQCEFDRLISSLNLGEVK